MRLGLIVLLVAAYAALSEAGDRQKRSIATGRGSFRPAKRDIEAVDALDDDVVVEDGDMDKRSMSIGRGSFRPGKRSLALGRNNFRPGKRADDTDGVDKRSLALGRNNFRPGKRDYEDDEEEETSPFEEKRSAAFGRFNFRPGKRSLALGRVNFRPGKRSLALGRSNFRPGKRATMAPCSYESMTDIAQHAEYLFALLEVHTHAQLYRVCIQRPGFRTTKST